MKRILLPLAGAAFVTLAPSLLAEPPAGKPKMNIEQRLETMKTNLGLSDDQVAKLKSLFEEQKAALDPIFQDQSLSPEQRREKARPINQETRQKVADVLTPEQREKMKEIRQQKAAEKMGQ